MNKQRLRSYGIILLGSLLFAAGLNLFIVPIGLYNGGSVGLAQIIRTLLVEHLGVSGSFDFAGIINFFINMPLLFLAFRRFGRELFLKSVFSVVMQTVFFSCIPIPTNPIITDRLTGCIIGGLVAGWGTGLVLRAGGSGGGVDILGLYFTSKNGAFSVGKMTVMVNACIYALCAVLFELPIAIYSIIFSAVLSFVVDKTHLQAIADSVLIFTKRSDLHRLILQELNRDSTYWKAVGGYTESETYCLITVLSKYDLIQLRQLLAREDPHAFVVVNEHPRIIGNYEIRL